MKRFARRDARLMRGEIVCIFPEGQITRTGLTLPFQRGLERIVKGRTAPIIPVHIDRATASIFSPMQRRRLPERIPLPVTVSFGTPLSADAPLSEIRRSITELDQEAWAYRKADRRPLHHEFIRRARRHPFRLALVDPITPALSSLKALAGAIAMARALRAALARARSCGDHAAGERGRRAREPGGRSVGACRRQPQLHRRQGNCELGRGPGGTAQRGHQPCFRRQGEGRAARGTGGDLGRGRSRHDSQAGSCARALDSPGWPRFA